MWHERWSCQSAATTRTAAEVEAVALTATITNPAATGETTAAAGTVKEKRKAGRLNDYGRKVDGAQGGQAAQAIELPRW